MLSTLAYLRPIALLIGSNVFMTLAWYGHLRFKEIPLTGVIVVSWAIAFVEYCMAVPANRWGSAVYTTAQLKTMQEVITLIVFVGFSIFYLKEPMNWNYAIGFALIAAGAFFFFAAPSNATGVLSEKYRIHLSLLFRFRLRRSMKACCSLGVWMLAGITFQSWSRLPAKTYARSFSYSNL
jgi:uncharacterized protein